MTDLIASRSVASVLQTSIERLGTDDAVATREFLTALQSLPKFVRDIARTIDEHDMDTDLSGGRTLAGKPFPDWPFLYDVIGEYETHKLLLIEKARQLMMTWLVAAIVVWEVRHSGGQRWGWVSLKSDHADAALERMWQIVQRLPGRHERTGLGHNGFRDAGGVLWTKSYNHIEIPQMSCHVHGMSQEANDARSFTMSGMVFDEFAFQPLAKSGYAAAKLTIDKGRVIGITTPGPFGFVCDLYKGKSFGLEDE